jgi:hypothetical protein
MKKQLLCIALLASAANVYPGSMLSKGHEPKEIRFDGNPENKPAWEEVCKAELLVSRAVEAAKKTSKAFGEAQWTENPILKSDFKALDQRAQKAREQALKNAKEKKQAYIAASLKTSLLSLQKEVADIEVQLKTA